MYDLNSEFDIEKHKEKFIHYFEAVIFPDGHVEYAVPSHQEKLINICCKELNVSRELLNDMCPQEYYFDFLTWLCNMSGCISVWNDFFMKSDKKDITNEQYKMLMILKTEGIYEGEI